MGRRRKQEENGLSIEHIKTNKFLNEYPQCQDCPIRIFNTNEKLTLGTGNIESNILFVLPTYDYNAKLGYTTILTLLADVYKEIKGKSIFEDVYITRVIKCFNKTDFNLNDIAAKHCNSFIAAEIRSKQWKKIIFFSNTYEEYISKINNNYDLKRITLYNKTKRVYNVYNPAILFYNNEKVIKEFKKDLTEILM